ncbi:hybrid sensor histidine kinase/response regulator transcription factor [Phocaeicola faecalis]
MKRNILFMFFLLPFIAMGQTYKYIGIEDGLSNRRIFNIQKDSKGYMWFLTNEGMDRYNGKEIKHYKLADEENKGDAQIRLAWLFREKEDLWIVGKTGRIFEYQHQFDRFTLTYKPANLSQSVPYSYLDNQGNVWLCGKDSITLYNTQSNQVARIFNPLRSNITSMVQSDNAHFFIATEKGLRYCSMDDNELQPIPILPLDEIKGQISKLYYHKALKRLFIGTFENGIFAYDLPTRQILHPETDLSDVNITQISPLNENELLIATEGMGVYKIQANSGVIQPYLTANYESNNEMMGNIINDIYVDEQKRIWLANYPTGITIVDSRYQNYHWIKHSMGNRQSLINDHVHTVIEDSEGDLWFGTSNGISLYNTKTRQWHSFLSSFDKQLKDKNHIFIALCEVTPGVIWAGGYTSGIYKINKKALSVEYFSPFLLTPFNMRPDKYIRDMIKDSEGNIWSGGYYNLKCFDLKNNKVQLYPGVNSITSIREKDNDHMWIGTATGLYLLNKNTSQYKYIEIPGESTYINTLYQASNGLLYIGTNGSGVIIYNPDKNTFQQFHTGNCALLTNSIFTILPEADGNIIMSTENGITCFSTKDKLFYNWTKEQGLMSANFNASAGVLLKDKGFIFGSIDGAIEFPKNIKFPHYHFSKIILSDFQLSYQPVFPGEENSPLTEDIDDTKVLRLTHNQNTFSLKVSTINYDFPSNVLYSWKLEGFYTAWSPPRTENMIRFTNLKPGKYKLHIRAVSKEEQNVIFEERTIDVIIAHPAWLSFWAILCYIVLGILLLFIITRIIYLRKQKKISDERTQFFINTAHDLRTPLTLIKAPLEELSDKEQLTPSGLNSMKTALKNVDALLRLTTNLINFEHTEVYSPKLYIAEFELNAYMQNLCNSFYSYSVTKNIDFTYESNFKEMKVWFDKEKMDSILKNIISNALKYTPDDGHVSVCVTDNKDTWKVKVTDTGIGIPTEEKKKIFKLHFRGSNAVNSKITGSGIGLMLVWKLVKLHGGKINIESTEHQGTVIRLIFHKGYEHLHHYSIVEPNQELPVKEVIEQETAAETPEELEEMIGVALLQRVLIVEDNDELRSYLTTSLSGAYTVQACSNGKEALIIIKEFWPDLILSDIMMPEMRGDELCAAIKTNIETSHIPIVLLTALNDEKTILGGLATGADAYITKPFSIKMLKARLSNILSNRALLQQKYAMPTKLGAEKPELLPAGANALDWKFITDVKNNIKNNIDNTDFTVDALCSLHNMSRTSFYNKLKALTGQPPADYIKEFRLNMAAQLLQEKKYSITEVAEMTGFCDSKYFREVFKKRFNVSPSKYGKEDKE